MGRKRTVSSLGLIAVVIAVILIISTSVTQMTVVSLDLVTIEGVGWKDGEDRWRDDYWVLYATTDTATELKLIKWNQQEAEKPTVQNTVTDPETGETYEAIPTSELEIRIYPQTPYYSVQLQWKQLEVYPETFGAYIGKFGGHGKLSGSVDELPVSFWVLESPFSYTLQTPYTAELWKNGEKLDAVTDDSYGGKNDILLTDPNSGQTVKVTNFGKGEFGYNPPVHDEILVFSSGFILETGDASVACDYIEYDKTERDSYSSYWWNPKPGRVSGLNRWSDESPRPFDGSTSVDDEHPGWHQSDDLTRFRWFPRAAKIYADQPNLDVYGLSLVNWLMQEKNLQSFNFLNNPALPWCQSVLIENNVLKLFMPAGSAYSNIVVRIPTELADTIVIVEYYPTATITAEWSTGGTEADIGDKLKAQIKVKNTAYNPQTGEGFGGTLLTKVSFEYGGEVGSAAPVQFTEWFEKNEEKTYEFMVHNTGAGEDTEFKVVFEVWNEQPELCDSAELTGKFLKTTEISTIVTVYTRSDVGKISLSGILVSISWDSESDSTYSTGGVAMFDLGHIEADVSLVATDPAGNYLPEEATGSVKGGDNVFYLDMKATEEPPPEDWTWLIWVLVIVSLAVTVSLMYKKKRKLKEWF